MSSVMIRSLNSLITAAALQLVLDRLYPTPSRHAGGDQLLLAPSTRIGHNAPTPPLLPAPCLFVFSESLLI